MTRITHEEVLSLVFGLNVEKTWLDRLLKENDRVDASNSAEELAKACADNNLVHPDWSLLAGRIQIWDLRQKVKFSFAENVSKFPEMFEPEYCRFVTRNKDVLEKMIHRERDLHFDLFGFATLFQSYLLRKVIPGRANPVFLETPQYMYLRMAVFLWYPNLPVIQKMYDRLSTGMYSHASPTAYNAGTDRPQLSSCFLMTIDDSMAGLTKSWHDCAVISKNTGGIGCDYSKIRHSTIRHFGRSKGIVNWLKIKQEILRSVDQGGRRKGSGTMYLPPWHIDVEEFLELRKNTGPEDLRARDLFQALWISDLFMKRVKSDEQWTLFCPKEAPGLGKVWGHEFEVLYGQHERAFPQAKKISARTLWQKIVLTQKETGMPFMLYKDACNRTSNHQHLGTIPCSNLCVEIVEYSSPEEIASCNLAAVCLPKCVRHDVFDFDVLGTLVAELVQNLNQAIDRTYYPANIPQIPYANLKNRPIGIGVQGLADTFALLDVAWESAEAKTLNAQIFEVMYYSAVEESINLAEKWGPFESFPGSPSEKGLLHFDLLKPPRALTSPVHSEEQWDTLRERMRRCGLRNSLLIALMPTASTAQILRNNEAFEPFTQMIFTRSVLSGTFVLVNRHLVRDLAAISLWTPDVRRQILNQNGSIQNLVLPSDSLRAARLIFLKEKYKTAYEIPQKRLLDLAIDRAPFVDQSQSLNAWFEPNVSFQQITSYHFYGWENRLKTGMYYLRQSALTNPVNHALGPPKPDSCDVCSA